MNLRRMDYVHINGEGELVERPGGLLVDWSSYEVLEADLAAALQSRNDECRLRQAAEAYAARLAVERGTLERECHREHDKNVGYMDRIAALEADRDRISLSLDLARADRDKWFDRARELEALLAARPPYYCQNCRCARCGNTFAVETDCAFCDGKGHEAQKICVHCDGSGKQADRAGKHE